MKAVIVCGSRKWTDELAIHDALSRHMPDVVIHGAAEGADTHAAIWAAENMRLALPMPAQWHRLGRRAGPIRNDHMLTVLLVLRECGYEVLVLAFPLPESVGTPDMIERAELAGVRVWQPKIKSAEEARDGD